MLRIVVAAALGLVAWALIGSAGLFLLRHTWSAYGLAEPHKAYSTAMLFARLGLGVLCTLTAGCVAAFIQRDGRTAAWLVGGLVLALSTPVHLIDVWADYPAWYHFAYLLPLLPLAAAGGQLARAAAARRSARPHASAKPSPPRRRRELHQG